MLTLEDIKAALVHHTWRLTIFSTWYNRELANQARWWVLYRISLKQDHARNCLRKLGQALEHKRKAHGHYRRQSIDSSTRS